MASKEYVIQTEHTSSSTAKHYHGESISTLNAWAKNNIPSNAVLTSIQVYYRGKCSLGDTKLYVGFTNSSSDEPSQKLISTEITTSAGDGWYGNIPSYSSTFPFNINASYSTLSVYMNSGILYKKFTCYSFKVIWNYYIPTYTVTVKAGTGGTVSGGGTFESGTTTTITATANKGYTFKQWNDGNTNASRTVTATGNVTYTAEFEPEEYEVIVECYESESGEKCTVSGAGIYKFGETITLTATVPPYHKFLWWLGGVVDDEYYYTETISIPITESYIGDKNIARIYFYCSLEHTGFLLKADASPAEGGVVEHGWYYTQDGKEYYYSKVIPSEGTLVDYKTGLKSAVEAIPNKGYRFVKWSDGNTENPRWVTISGDISFTAYFEKQKFKVTYQNADGTVLQETEVEYGDEQPPYTGATPTLESTAEYDYVFKYWDSETYYITGDVIVTAYYEKVKRWYNITVMPSPSAGGVPQYLNYAYGTKKVITARPNSGYEFVKWQDGVTTPSREITVTGEATYTAYFRRVGVIGDLSRVKKVLANFDEVNTIKRHAFVIYEKGL